MIGRCGTHGRLRSWGRRERLASRPPGATLIEVLVALAASVVVLGAVLGIYDATSRLSKRSVGRESMLAEARQIAQTIEESLRAYAAPANIQIPNGAPSDRFAEDEAVFYCSDPAPGAAMWRVRIANKDFGEAAGARAVMSRLPAREGDRIEESAGAGQIALGVNKGETTTRVRFSYAYGFNGLEPIWTSQAQPGRPRLVEFEVTVAPRKPGKGDAAPNLPVRLASAVALGD